MPIAFFHLTYVYIADFFVGWLLSSNTQSKLRLEQCEQTSTFFNNDGIELNPFKKKNHFISGYFSLIFSPKTWLDDGVINGCGRYWRCNFVDKILKQWHCFLWMQISYKLVQHVLQIRAAFLLQIGTKLCYKLGQLFYNKSGQSLLLIGEVITNWGKVYYKLKQVLQLRVNYYKVVYNS